MYQLQVSNPHYNIEIKKQAIVYCIMVKINFIFNSLAMLRTVTVTEQSIQCNQWYFQNVLVLYVW